MRAFLGIDILFVNKDINHNLLNEVKSHHLTLFFWDDLSEAESKDMQKKMGTIEEKRFFLTADRIISFPDKEKPQLLALGFKEEEIIQKFRERIISLLQLADKTIFHPHVTLYRKEKLDSSFKVSKEIYKKINETKITIDNVSLYSSDPQKGLNQYRLLKKILLE
ncbi:MAG: RNA 2',3'-cyclic phosphodiesterase [Nanoarchaeota archaeon]|nr:RNA 2',3'-cyclic phosphodiesterase [Nanoarchaeota archaeon]